MVMVVDVKWFAALFFVLLLTSCSKEEVIPIISGAVSVVSANVSLNPLVDDTFDEDTVRTGSEAWNVADLMDNTGESVYLKFGLGTIPSTANITGAKLCQWIYDEGALCGTAHQGNCASNEALRVEVWDNQTWLKTDTLCSTVSCAAYLATIDDYHVMNHTGFTDAVAPQLDCFEHRNLTIAINRSIELGHANITFVIRRIGGDTADYYQWYSLDYATNPSFRPVINVSYTYLTGNYNDVVFNTSFPGANLINVVYVSGDAVGNRLYTAELNYSTSGYNDGSTNYANFQMWHYFGLSNISHKNVSVRITNLQSVDEPARWTNERSVYSWDNIIPGNWNRTYYSKNRLFTTYNSVAHTYTIRVNDTHNRIWVASNYPYPYQKVMDYLHAKDISSASLNLTRLGLSERGRNITMVTITDASYLDSEKFNIFIITGLHECNEQQGLWEARGMIDWLTSTNTTARNMIQDYVIRVVMVGNPDNNVEGRGRYFFNGSVQGDPDRFWTAARSVGFNTIEVVRPYVNTLQPDLFMDWHGMITNAENQLYYPSDGDHSETAIMNAIATYYPETGSRVAQSTAGISTVEVDNLGVLSVLVETSQGVAGGTLYNRSDWEGFGVAIIRGVYSYFGSVQNDPVGGSPCVYGGSGGWSVSFADGCYLASNTFVDGRLLLSGTGNFTVPSGVSLVVSDDCVVAREGNLRVAGDLACE